MRPLQVAVDERVSSSSLVKVKITKKKSVIEAQKRKRDETHTHKRPRKVKLKLKDSVLNRAPIAADMCLWVLPLLLLLLEHCKCNISLDLCAIEGNKHKFCLHIYGSKEILRKNCSYHVTMHHPTQTQWIHHVTTIAKNVLTDKCTHRMENVNVHDNHISSKIYVRKFILMSYNRKAPPKEERNERKRWHNEFNVMSRISSGMHWSLAIWSTSGAGLLLIFFPFKHQQKNGTNKQFARIIYRWHFLCSNKNKKKEFVCGTWFC